MLSDAQSTNLSVQLVYILWETQVEFFVFLWNRLLQVTHMTYINKKQCTMTVIFCVMLCFTY